MSVPKIPSGQSQAGQLGAGCSPESTQPRPWGGAAPPGAGPASLSPWGLLGAHPSRGQGLTAPLPCSLHRRPPGSAATSHSPCQTSAGAAVTTCRWGQGWGRGGRPGARAPQRPSTATAWDFLPGPWPHLGRALCPLLPSSCGDVLEVPAGSEVGHVPLPLLPALCPCRSSPSSAAASTTASDTRWPCPAQGSHTPQVRRTAAGAHPGEGG